MSARVEATALGRLVRRLLTPPNLLLALSLIDQTGRHWFSESELLKPPLASVVRRRSHLMTGKFMVGRSYSEKKLP
jgi:hypothetical protein